MQVRVQSTRHCKPCTPDSSLHNQCAHVGFSDLYTRPYAVAGRKRGRSAGLPMPGPGSGGWMNRTSTGTDENGGIAGGDVGGAGSGAPPSMLPAWSGGQASTLITGGTPSSLSPPAGASRLPSPAAGTNPLWRPVPVAAATAIVSDRETSLDQWQPSGDAEVRADIIGHARINM